MREAENSRLARDRTCRARLVARTRNVAENAEKSPKIVSLRYFGLFRGVING